MPQSGVAQSQSGQVNQNLKKIERQIGVEKSTADEARARAEIMARDITNLQTNLVSAAKAVQHHEQQVEALQARLGVLGQLTEQKTSDLRKGRAKFRRVLAAMQRIAQFPPEALIAQPVKPADTVRTAILLKAAVSEVERQGAVLRDELDFLARTRIEIAEREQTLRDTSELLNRERRRLGALMSLPTVILRCKQGRRFC